MSDDQRSGPPPKAGRQIIGGLLLCVAASIVYLLWPVCVPIPELPMTERGLSLEELAASGEPLEKKDGIWYHCKPRLARAFF